MSLTFACPNPSCRKPIAIAVQHLDSPVRCPYCGQVCRPSQPKPAVTHSPPPDDSTSARQEVLLPDPPATQPPAATLDDAAQAVPLPPAGISLSASPGPDTSLPVLATLADQAMAVDTPPSVIPVHFGRFQLHAQLREDSSGVVYRAHDPQQGREVELKVFKSSTRATEQGIERFLREAGSLPQLWHPHIVPVFETGRDGAQCYIASASIAGHTLETDLHEKGPMDARRAARITRRLAEALAYGHSRGVVHRDVRPVNVLLNKQGQPLLLDFGVACRSLDDSPLESRGGADASPEPEEDPERLTQAGTILGTSRYMSPEQWSGRWHAVGPASDQYSLGILLYELLTGQTPWNGPIPELQLHHLHTTPPPLRPLRPSVPQDLEAICRKCLAKRPEERYPDCQKLADDLRRFEDGELVEARLEFPASGLALPGPGFPAAVGWSLLALLGPVLVGCCLGAALVVRTRARGQPLEQGSWLVLSTVAGAVVMLAVVLWNLRSGARRALALRGISMTHLLLILLLILPCMVLSGEISTRATHGLDAVFGPREPTPRTAVDRIPPVAYIQHFDQLWEQLARLPWPLALLCGCLLPGVVEEVFFRGFLGRGLVGRYGAVGGVLLTSLLFALSHIDPVQIAYTMVLGMVLHLVYLTTKSLLGPIVLHALNNALAVANTKLTLEGTLQLGDLSGTLVIPPLLGGVALAAVIVLCGLLYRTRVAWTLADGRVWSAGYTTAEMPPPGPTGPRRHGLSLAPALLAVGVYLAFGVVFAQAALSWHSQGAALAQVQRARILVEKGEYDPAIAACSEALRLDPRLADAYLVRSEAHRNKGSYPQALANCDKAIEMDPGNALAYAQRGATHWQQGSHDRALADCSRAIELDRQLAWAYSIRGGVYEDRNDYARAAVDWNESLRLEPNHAWTNTRLAWLLATCSDARHRGGPRAVTLARRGCELTEWKDVDALAALAAAHAECGQFQEARRWQEKAENLATGEQKQFSSALLREYQAGRPYRERR